MESKETATSEFKLFKIDGSVYHLLVHIFSAQEYFIHIYLKDVI